MFWVISFFYFRRFAQTSPLKTASAFTGFVVFFDAAMHLRRTLTDRELARLDEVSRTTPPVSSSTGEARTKSSI